MTQQANVGDFIKMAGDGILWKVENVFLLIDGSYSYDARLHGYPAKHTIYGKLSIHESDIYEVIKGEDA